MEDSLPTLVVGHGNAVGLGGDRHGQRRLEFHVPIGRSRWAVDALFRWRRGSHVGGNGTGPDDGFLPVRLDHKEIGEVPRRGVRDLEATDHSRAAGRGCEGRCESLAQVGELVGNRFGWRQPVHQVVSGHHPAVAGPARDVRQVVGMIPIMEQEPGGVEILEAELAGDPCQLLALEEAVEARQVACRGFGGGGQSRNEPAICRHGRLVEPTVAGPLVANDITPLIEDK